MHDDQNVDAAEAMSPQDDSKNPFESPSAAPEMTGSQFGLKTLLATTAGFGVLFGILSALGINEINTLVAFAGAVAAAGVAILLISIYWSASGGPRPRDMPGK